MRICILANALAVHTQRWARALAERGHEVTVLSIRSAKIPSVRVISKSVGPINSPSRLWSLLSYLRLALGARRVLATLRPDVVNAHYCVTHGSIARIAGARPLVVNLWGSDVIGPSGADMPYWKRVLVRFSTRSADAVVSTSRFMADALNRILGKEREIDVVPFGVDTTHFRPAESSDAGFGKNDASIVVGFVKTFSPVYAPEDFLRAAAIAATRNPDLRFVMAGRGPLHGSCKSFADELGIAELTDFPGFVEQDVLPRTMASFDILVNCSRSESFGVVILEGSACGVPVIATDVGGVRETLRDGTTGLLVPSDNPEKLADAICALAADPERRLRMGEAGRRMVRETYEWRTCLSAFESVLQNTARI